MAIDMLIKEAEGLTDTDMEKVCEYIHFLKYRVQMGRIEGNKPVKKEQLEGLKALL